MSTLNTLKLVNVKKPTAVPPLLHRRYKISKKVWEQIQLAKAKKEGSTFTIKQFKTVKGNDGSRLAVEVHKQVRPWWFTATDGKTCLNIRYGAKVVELAKGKTAIEIANTDDLIKTLELVKTAVDAGELDTQIEAASGAVRSGFTRS